MLYTLNESECASVCVVSWGCFLFYVVLYYVWWGVRFVMRAIVILVSMLLGDNKRTIKREIQN